MSADEVSRGRSMLLLTAGFLIASVGALCGIGGGIFAVPLLHYGFRLPLKTAVATTLCLVCATATSATIGESFHPENALHPLIIGIVLSTALIGAQAGFQVAQRLPTRQLKMLFAVVLIYVGIRLLGSASVPHVDASGFEAHREALITAAIIGLFAGFVVPLLGVGGGLVMVPALLLFLPEFGFQGARATSMAVAMVTAARSLYLYSQKGDIRWPIGLRFGIGAFLGAQVGVRIAHLHGSAEIGQILLGAVLCLAALRFALDVRRLEDERQG